jgi:hypothetical protein
MVDGHARQPAKGRGRPSPQEVRMRRAAEIAAHPRIWISGAEQRFGTRYTADLIGS